MTKTNPADDRAGIMMKRKSTHKSCIMLLAMVTMAKEAEGKDETAS